MRSGFASLIGRPNAGKSMLLNRLVGTKLAIVSDKPQTTRNRILAVARLNGNPTGQVVFLDTPGIHRPLHRMNVRMVQSALETISSVDVVVVVIDASVKVGAGDRYVLTQLKGATVPLVLALNKIDLIRKTQLLPLIEWYRQQRDFAVIVPVSALTGDGQKELECAIGEQLPEGAPLYPEDYLTDQPERLLAAEMVREKILWYTSAELPFSTAVVVDQFEEQARDGGGILKIYCSVLVEREGQKRIVVGRQGALIKKIGTEARRELEGLFSTKVYLDLHVKVRAGWRDDDHILGSLGITRTP